ncbi:MAG TPA: NAD(P)H-dependent glycerol-3-phosphate dehydrogenase [Blastocatellia bacterium]|nr:NAD(P)H-dependent glycerol-3-phosphate dehydrogenase [Blastocatellia bacterium]
MKVAVIGSGSWGTALALHAARIGHDVWLWSRRADAAAELDAARVNTAYLPGFPFPPHIRATSDLAEAVKGATLVLLVVPSHGTREVLGEMKGVLTGHEILVCASKGIENETLARMSEVVSQVFDGGFDDRYVVLSGPSFAAEVARGVPTAIVAASPVESSANVVQKELSSGSFRVYTNDDVVGVELGGALKNVIAIATGGVTGLGLGHNTVAAIITRGLAEMTRLAVAMGGHVETLSGLAGLGDLVLTCTGDLSRNRFVGIELGRGRSLDEILADMREVAEGVRTTRAARALGVRAGVELPITNAVYSLLYEGGRPRAMADALMGRPLKKE